MRKIDFKKIGLAAMMLLSALTFQSCDNDNDTDWDRVFPNALVTVKKSGDACYLQLDDNTTLLAKNLKPTIFDGKEVRALVNYSQTSEKSEKYNQVIHVNWIDSILTRSLTHLHLTSPLSPLSTFHPNYSQLSLSLPYFFLFINNPPPKY